MPRCCAPRARARRDAFGGIHGRGPSVPSLHVLAGNRKGDGHGPVFRRFAPWGQRREGGSMFDQLVNEEASRFGLPAPRVTALLRELLSLMANGRTGGAEGFI